MMLLMILIALIGQIGRKRTSMKAHDKPVCAVSVFFAFGGMELRRSFVKMPGELQDFAVNHETLGMRRLEDIWVHQWCLSNVKLLVKISLTLSASYA